MTMICCPRCGCRPRGLVIREVVILLLVPGLLLSLLLVAVNQAREAARRMQCANNLRMVGIATLNYESTYQRLPAGAALDLAPQVRDSTPTAASSAPLYGWAARSLTFTERLEVYDELWPFRDGLESALRNPSGRSSMQRALPEFRCGSDVSAPPRLNIGRPFAEGQEEQALGLSNYVGCFGSRPLSDSTAAAQANGLFLAHQGLRLRDITDGMSNTLLAGERAWKHSGSRHESRAALWAGTRSARGSSHVGLADVLGTGAYRINFDAVDSQEALAASWQRQGFSSNHPGGAQFLWADASVAFLANDTDADMDPLTQRTRTAEIDSVWERLLCRHDGQAESDEGD